MAKRTPQTPELRRQELTDAAFRRFEDLATLTGLPQTVFHDPDGYLECRALPDPVALLSEGRMLPGGMLVTVMPRGFWLNWS